MVSPNEPMLDALRGALAEGPALRLAMLFGSVARGRQRPDSDVDIAILPRDPDLPLAAELDLQNGLAKAAGREVDLVRIDHASVLLAWEIAKHGRVLLAEPAWEAPRFLARAAIEHADFAESVAPAQRLFLRRLMGEGGSSR